jgi:acetyl esterase/lipase
MNLLPKLFCLLAVPLCLNAQNNMTFPVWPDGAPGALGKEAKDVPTLTVYLAAPDKATGAAIVICPGGGYAHLADHEGSHYARWLNEQGIAGFVLKYRLGSGGYRHPAMLLDAARASGRFARARTNGTWMQNGSASSVRPPVVTSPPR